MTQAAKKKGGRKPSATTELIREVAGTLGTFSPKQLREFGFSEAQAWTAVDTLLRQGRTKKIGKGRYEYIPEPARGKAEAPLADRIWHAMRINAPFCCADIALQAGTSLTYVWLRLREYLEEGLVRPSGRRGKTKLWRLTLKGRQETRRPETAEFAPDPTVAMTTKLNRLVCTGLVRFGPERREAIRLCGEIAAGLSKEGA